MKKYVDHITAMTHEAKNAHVSTLTADIAQLSRGIKQGDVQNVRIVRAKRKELARTLTFIKAHAKEVSAAAKTVAKTKKETK